jgi:hypothetical protein
VLVGVRDDLVMKGGEEGSESQRLQRISELTRASLISRTAFLATRTAL